MMKIGSLFLLWTWMIDDVVSFHVGIKSCVVLDGYGSKTESLGSMGFGNDGHWTLRRSSMDDDNNSSSNEDGAEMELLGGVEKAWRYAKKPLLRIGNKGATLSHGNSLRELLQAHTVVKVKINSTKMGTLTEAFHTLSQLAQKSTPDGSSSNGEYELLHTRPSDNIILLGLPGTLEKIESGDFPPSKIQVNE